MRPALLKIAFGIICFIYLSNRLSAQSCFNTGLNGTVINLPCNQNCVNIPVRIPHLKSASTYIVNDISYNPYPYATATGNELVSIYVDDKYSELVTLPFGFCFYDSIYGKVVIGSNGIITFDETTALQNNAYQMNFPIPYAGGAPNVAATTYYPPASIMAAYSDLDPRLANSPNDRKIEWRVEGSSPCRRFIASYFHVGTFGADACAAANPNTLQIVIYESTGIVEVFIENKSCTPTTNGGKAVLGVQNWARNAAVAAPGKNATNWNSTNEGYRFVPSGGVSRFVSCVVQTMAGAQIAIGDTVTTVAGTLDVTFPSFCPTGATGQYVVKTIFSACDNAANQLVSYDTITVNKTNSLNATSATTQTACGVSGTGTATITVPAGIGTPPYTFVLNPGGTTLTGNSPQQFTGLSAGSYTVVVTDAGGSCSSTVPFTITSTGALAVTYNVTNTTCVGAANGGILVNPPNGTPPITYSINGGPFAATNNFTGLAPGTYFISTHDAAGCQANFIPVTVDPGPSITMTAVPVATSCPGAANGSITVTNATGTPPYQYSINGGPYQSSPTFNGLIPGTYFISLIDASGCTISFIPVTVDQGAGTVNGTATPTSTTCTGVADGKITVTGTGTGPFEYSLNSGPYQSSGLFTGLAAGTYTIIIREAGLCLSAPISVTITAGPGLTSGITAGNTTCTGVNNGSITVTPAGTGPFTAVLDGTITITGNSPLIFNNVGAGPHSVTITATNGCSTAAPLTVTVAAGSGYTASFAPTPTGCAGANNGKLVITAASPGTAPFTVVLNPGAITQTTASMQATFNGLAAGTYSAVITDANGCQFTLNNMTVTAGAGLVVNPTPTGTSCTGVNNGSITVTSNGTPPLTFVLDGTVTQTSATNTTTFINLAPGSHTITVTDAVGCVTTAPVTTTIPTGSGFTASFAPTPTGCAGATNGKLVITAASPGTAPFTVLLNPGAVTQTTATMQATFNGLAAGTYSAVITDANGCQFTLNNMTVTAGAGLVINPTPTGTSCTGVNNGSITVTSNGTPPLTFVLDGTVTQTSATNTTTFINLAAGSHSITVTDAVGCITTAPVTTTVPAGSGFTASFAPTPTGCAGATNGKLVITAASPGTAPFTVVLNPGAVTQTTATMQATFNGLAAGTYSAVITDANGCQFTLNNMTVAAGAGLVVNPTPTGTSCTGVNNGSILVTSNGTPPLTFVLDGTVTQTSATNTTTFINLAAGSHSITVTDAAGCITTAPVTTTIPTGSGFTVSFAPTPTGCAGANNGKLDITAANPGTPPFTVILNPGAITQTTASMQATFNGLAAGTYNAVITDANGCQFTLNNMTVPTGAGLVVNPTPTGTSCTGVNNGSILVTSNGTAPLTFVLDGTVTQTSATNTTSFTGLAAGSHTITVTDAIGCVTTAPVTTTVAAGTGFTASFARTDAKCSGANNGKLDITVQSPGTAPFTIVLNPGAITQTSATTQVTFNNLTAGTYSALITDANGCQYTLNNMAVGQPAQLAATTNQQAVLCYSGSTGKIFINATGGTAPYSYSLDGITYQSLNQFAVPAGIYSVYVKDANGCTLLTPLTNVSVNEPALLTALSVTGNATCDGGNNGTINITPAGGAAPYQFAITGGGYQSTGSFNVAPGTYDITVKDVNGCTYPVNGIVVGLTNNLTYTPMVDQTAICESKSVQLQITTNATQFLWNGPGLSNATIVNPVATPSLTTLYTVTATLGRCFITDDVLVSILAAPTANAGVAPVDGICYGQIYQLQGSAQGSGNISYKWAPSTYLSNTTIYNPVTTPEKTITYSLTVQDANGCVSLVPSAVTVKVTPPIKVNVYPADTIVQPGAQIPLRATSAATDYTWIVASGPTGLNDPNIYNPVATAPLAAGSVIVYKVTATTAAGCRGDAYARIQVYKGPDLYMVSAFTPDGDGKNDKFVPFPVGIKEIKYFRVLNRWGQTIYYTTELNNGWDGRFFGKEQPTGVYVWMVQGITMDNKVITKKGTVTLIR